MYTAIKGTYESGHITLDEAPPTTKKMHVLITFLEDTETGLPQRKPGSLKRLGILKGKHYTLPENFNEPLDDLTEYMM